MAGNRDFLVGRRFASASGPRILKDPQLVDFGGMRTLISHGDRYCSDDVGYQRWRHFSRNAFVQWLFMRLPRDTRHKIAGGLRPQSGAEKRNKPPANLDGKENEQRTAAQPQKVTHKNKHQ